MFFSVKIVDVNVNPVASKGFIGETFYIYITKKRVYKLGYKPQVFDLSVKSNNNILYIKTTCLCDEHDVFNTKINLKDFNRLNSFSAESTIVVPHENDKDFVEGTKIKLLFKKHNNITSLSEARQILKI